LNTYFAIFLIATVASLILTPLIRRLCERFKLLDIPDNGRRAHSRAVPRLGGIAIYLSCLTALTALPFLDNTITQTLRGQVPEILTVVIPCTLVLLLGIYDDLRGANATVKFIGLGLIAVLFYAMGGRIVGMSIPFLGPIQIGSTLSFLLTVLWLVGISNAFNLIDGLDGLASGAALFSSLAILAVSFAQGTPLNIIAALILCGSLAGFLRYNFNPASIFLGDSGALFIGFMLASLSIVGSMKATTAVAVVVPVLAFGLPVVDTTVTMARRVISRQPVFRGDKEHIHHMLLARGWSQRRVAIALYGVCAVFGLLAIAFNSTGSNWTGFVLFVMSVVVIIAVGHLRYHEVDELRAGVRRAVGGRRLKVAHNIRVRRAARALSKAREIHELFAAVTEMLEFGEFAYASALIGRTGEAEINERAVSVSRQHSPNQSVALRGGRISWSWHQLGIAADDVIESTEYWCLRLPLGDELSDLGWMNFYRAFDGDPLLVDTNYLVDLFRRELSEATSRILTSHRAAVGVADLRITETV